MYSHTLLIACSDLINCTVKVAQEQFMYGFITKAKNPCITQILSITILNNSFYENSHLSTLSNKPKCFIYDK